jgi:hypothetical protein
MTKIYEIGPFRLDAGNGVLTRDGTPAALGSRAVAVLAVLVEEAHQFVPKASIMDAAWPGLVVEENNLAVQVAAIRRVLAQAPAASAGSRRSSIVVIGCWAGRGADGRPTSRNERPAVNRRGADLSNGRERELGVAAVSEEPPRCRRWRRRNWQDPAALQAAAEVVDAYRDGVWLAEWVFRDPALVPTTVAQALECGATGTPVTESLRAISSRARCCWS